MIAPCRGCTDRNAECHGKCGKYQEYVEWRKQMRHMRDVERIYWNIVRDGINKMEHYKNRHKGATPSRGR